MVVILFWSERGGKMQRQSSDCEEPPLHQHGQSGVPPRTHRVRAETATVSQGRNYAGMLAAERSRASSRASAMAFLLIQLTQ
jgi:hypothetical protein